MARGNIPVMMFGIQVGTCAINDDGSFVTHIESNQFGVDILAEMDASEYTSMTFLPTGAVLQPPPPPSE